MDGVIHRRVLRVVVALAGAALLVACKYGSPIDDSGFESSAVSPDGKALAVAYHQLMYRPATGLTGFFNGGAAQYDRDRIVLALSSANGADMRVLRAFPADGMPGSAHVAIRAQPNDPQHMLVILTDQSSARAMPRARRWRLGLTDGSLEPLPDVERELAMVGKRLGAREFGDLRLAAPDGTMLLGVNGADGDQLWVRTAGGRLHLLDPLTHFYGQVDDEIYLWSGDHGVVRNWRTGARRIVSRADPVTTVTKTLIQNDPTVMAIEQSNRLAAPRVVIGPERQTVSVDGAMAHLDVAALTR